MTSSSVVSFCTNPSVRTHRPPTLWAVELRPYQIPIFNDNATGILGLHWARQLGKSTVLAAWAVDRLLTLPVRLVTVLGNCQQNGSEFAEECANKEYPSQWSNTINNGQNRFQGSKFQKF